MIRAALAEGIRSVSGAGPALASLFAQLDQVPEWVDWEQLDAGGAVVIRSGILGCFILALRSLPRMYSSPAGNKALALSGRVRHKAARRLGETGRFVYLTSQPGSLRRHAAGFKVTVRVRLMHAQIRRYLKQSPRWKSQLWGEPISQSFMALTSLLLSVDALDAMETCGFRLCQDERAAVMHLWRYSGYLSGLAPEMIFGSESEARRMLELITAVDGPPDASSRLMTSSLMDVSQAVHIGPPSWFRGACYGISEALIGRDLARQLCYPRTVWSHLLPAISLFVRGVSLGRPWSRSLDRTIYSLGAAGWSRITGAALEGAEPNFTRPSHLHTRLPGGNMPPGRGDRGGVDRENDGGSHSSAESA
jgi:hypothetical protein